jgi:TetR/AcrR family transcriptional regulator
MRKRPRTSALRGSGKEAVRNAAAELFAEKVFTATSTREICERAGITKPVLYYHFGNKQQLYEELVRDTYHEYRKEIVRAARRGRTPREKRLKVLIAINAYVRRRPNYWRAGFRMVLAPEKGTPPVDYVEMSQADERLLAELIHSGVRSGELRGDPEFIAGSLVGVTISNILCFLLTGQPALDKTLAQKTLARVIEGCARKSTSR